MHVHGGREVLCLPSVGEGWLSRCLLLRRNFFSSEVALLQVVDHYEAATIILLDEPLVVEVVEVGVELLGLVDGLSHPIDLSLQLRDFSHLGSKLGLLELLPSLGLGNFLLAPSSL